MAALTTWTPSVTATTTAPTAVSASDTIAESQFGPIGVEARVVNGGASSDTVTVVDPGSTPLGNAGTSKTYAVGNGTFAKFLIPRAAINSSTGVATVTHSYTTTVTIELTRV